MTNLSCGVRFTCTNAGCSVHTKDEDKSLESVVRNKMGQNTMCAHVRACACLCMCVCVRGEEIG